MSTCAAMLVKDEADIIEPVLRHLAYHVDAILVADNGSTDGTREVLAEIELPVELAVADDDEIGYLQSDKTTALAMEALALGHDWVIPCDADEVWYVGADHDMRVADFLASLGPDVKLCRSLIYNHFPTSADPPALDREPLDEAFALGAPIDVISEGITREQDEDDNPLRRIGWRHRVHAPARFGKVACRLLPGLVIEAGNHGAYSPTVGIEAGGLELRHFSWRTAEQYLRKIRNGERAYAATSLPSSFGEHWRMWAGKPDDAVHDWFSTWAWKDNPERDDELEYDPAPVKP